MARSKRPKLYYRATNASTARAKYTELQGAVHTLEFTFVTEDGSDIIIEMPHTEAKKLLEQGIAAYSAIQAPLQYPRNIPWGG